MAAASVVRESYARQQEQQERDKDDKIAAVAAAGAAVAVSVGQDPEQVRDFLQHYFRHVDAADVDSRSVEDLVGLVESHYRAAQHRPAGRAAIRIRTPHQPEGWSAGGATVVQVVTDDRPFLVDSLTMEVLRQGWSVREVFHPQYLVLRDSAGDLQTVARADAASEPGVLPESWMHMELLPPAEPVDPEELLGDLERGLREVLDLVDRAVEDWSQMRARAEETAELLTDPSRTGGHAAEAGLARELLGWLNSNHFTYLGYREHVLVGEGEEARYAVVPGTGLGTLRGDEDGSGFAALPLPGTTDELLVVAKDDARSRVHRPAYLDYLGFRTFGADGRVTGERRFLGLFSSAAYSESVARVPVLRQKVSAVLAATGYDEQSHGGKAVLDVLETYPRDELFQTPLAVLTATVEKIAHLKERRQVRMFVRPDPYGRYLS